jgi:uncharacterized glyoxalase superfamily metalloenzyme YdcJ
MSAATFLEPWQLRAAFARSLSDMYGKEVPAYTTLLDVSHEVNADFAAKHGADAERLGSIARVTAERHGAIRVGTPTEMSQVARVFGAMGMRPVGFYDLRDASSSSVPVISTAFRPIEREELARNPFRVFTSMLVTADRRFFTADLERRLENFLAARTLFGPELLALADRAEAEGGLPEDQAAEFLRLATQAFELSDEPVDQAWYRELEAVSAVAADIGGIASTHINHLTPRVLDIDDLYARMEARGITMIDAIQGPPRWAGPDVLLRQTSFRALAEPRTFRTADGEIVRDAPRTTPRCSRSTRRPPRPAPGNPGSPRRSGRRSLATSGRRPSRRRRRSSRPRASAGSPTRSTRPGPSPRSAANPSTTRTSCRAPRPASSSPT